MTTLRAADALSDQVAKTSVDARPSEALQSAATHAATHAAVHEGEHFRGLVDLRSTLSSSPERIFADLLPDGERVSLPPEAPVKDVGRLLRESNVDAIAIVDDQGGFIGAVTQASLLEALLADKTESLAESNRLRAAIEAGHARLRAILETAVDGVITIDQRGRIEFFNPAAERIFGYSAGDMIGRNVSVLMMPDDAEHHDAYLRNYLRTGQAKIIGRGREVVGRRQDGTTFPLDLAIADARVGEEVRFTAFVRDISDRKRAEEALRKSRDELEQRVAERTTELTAVNERLRSEMAQRERAEEALRESELWMRNIFNSLEESVLVVTADRRLVNVNAAAEATFGYSRDEMVNRSTEFLHVDREHYLEFGRCIQEAFDRGEAARLEFEAKRKNGEVFPTEHTVSLLKNDAGEAVGIVSVIRDASEHKRAEEARRENERRYRTLFEQLPDAVVILDPDTTLPIEFNDLAPQMLGYSREEFAKLPVSAYEATESPQEVRAHVEKVQREGRDEFETTLRTKRGEIIDVLVNVRVIEIGGRRVFNSILRDITERKQTEEALRTKAIQLASVSDAMASFVLSGDWRDASAELLRSALIQTGSSYGFVGVVAEGPTLRILAHEGIEWDAVVGRKLYEDALDQYQRVGYLEFTNFENLFGRVITGAEPVIANDPASDARSGGLPAGHPPLRHFLGVPILRGSDVVGMIGVANRVNGYTGAEQDKIEFLCRAASVLYDSYRRRQREAALEEERKRAEQERSRLAAALESAGEAIMITDVNGSIEYVNAAFIRIHGFSREEAIGKSPRILKSGKHDVEFYRDLWNTLLRGEVWSGEIINRNRDGSLVHVEETIAPIRNAAGEIINFVAVERDITERKQAQERERRHQAQMAHVARLSTMGEMATGLAHELNQPLSAIMNYSEVCRRRIPAGRREFDDPREDLEQIALQAERAGAVIRRVRSFVRKREPGRSSVNLNAAIRAVTDLLAADARANNVTVRLDLADNIPSVLADSIQIQQVILNLMRNAIEAMSATPAEQRLLIVRTSASEAAMVEIAVSDNGPPMELTDAERLFEPFFTTKPEGMGMGLSISRSIIEDHRGRLRGAPNPDRGATFKVTLPVNPGDEANVQSE